MKKVFSFLLAFAFFSSLVAKDKMVSVKSPDGQVEVNITVSDKIYYDVTSHGELLFKQSHIGLELLQAKLGINPVLQSSKSSVVNSTVKPIFPLKNSIVENNYTLLTMKFKGGYSVIWRVYDDGIAYRFETKLPGKIQVVSEDCTINLAEASELILQQTGGFITSCEELYTKVHSNEWNEGDKMSELPFAIVGSKQKMLFSEYELFDYPGMFVKGNAGSIYAIHPKVPLEFGPNGDRSLKILKEADYIAETDGTRSFPWRAFFISQDDKSMAMNEMSVRLSTKSAIEDCSWIKPGKTTWEWWNGSIPYGPDVNFKSGLNLETYKYFVDFAAQNGLEYILMDEGWAMSTLDPFTPNSKIDLHELIRFAASKNVGIILWLTWLCVENNMSLFETFEKWGIKGVKIDFMDRQDQWMVNYYERVSKEAAKHHLFVDFHGAYHPSGMEFKYPNILSFEGVRGMEQMGGCRPENSVYFPAIRNAVGPMDYTPGAMLSAQPECYSSRRPNSASIGTRAYQMALYVLFESHIQMMADNPTLYNMYPDCRDFIAACPVNWDETKVLAAEFGEYTVVARRKGDTWYIGGMTNNNSRSINVPADFLPKDKSYKMISFEDGINADVQAMDYRRREEDVKASDMLKIEMVRNGGFAAVLKP